MENNHKSWSDVPPEDPETVELEVDCQRCNGVGKRGHRKRCFACSGTGTQIVEVKREKLEEKLQESQNDES